MFSRSVDGQTEFFSSCFLEYFHLNCVKWRDFKETKSNQKEQRQDVLSWLTLLKIEEQDKTCQAPRIQKASSLGVTAHISHGVSIFPFNSVYLALLKNRALSICVLKSKFWHGFLYSQVFSWLQTFHFSSILSQGWKKFIRSLSYY